jgi:glycosyltransferase involved in cell wall biosynthesis
MRILMQLEPGTGSIPGGHARQARKTAEYLRRLGLDVCLSDELERNLEDFDLVHIFGVSEELIRHAKDHAKPVAVSTIYWSYGYELEYARTGGWWSYFKADCRKRLCIATSVILAGDEGHRKHAEFWARQAARSCSLRMADLLLPNAQAEADDLIRECGVAADRIRVVPNSVDASGVRATADQFISKHGIQDFVLSVGRVEPRKNQLRLIQSMRSSDKKLVIVDPVHPHHGDYLARCRHAMASNMLYLQRLGDDMLQSAYAAAKVHVLPSFYETTGLATLEAAIAGCNVVVNEQAHTREYFQDFAWYCDPAKPATIRSAIEAAYASPFREQLRDRILQNFTWEHTARATLAAYESMLRRRSKGGAGARNLKVERDLQVKEL